jgi:putative FmdB family regulatory protein
MPVYEYACPPCRVIYEVRHGMTDPVLAACPRCRGEVARLISAPNVNRGGFSSPTAARYARMGEAEERARERELQAGYERIWLPPPVKHDPWEGP